MRALAVALAVALLSGPAAADTTVPSKIGTGIANLRLVDLDGTRWTRESLRGRVTLIDVWATWCAPCLTELPYLKRVRARYSRDEFEILGVNFDVSDRRTVISWMNRQNVGWPQVFDGRGRNGLAARQLSVSAVPTTVLVNAAGDVVAMNLRGDRLVAAIDAQVRTLREARAAASAEAASAQLD